MIDLKYGDQIWMFANFFKNNKQLQSNERIKGSGIFNLKIDKSEYSFIITDQEVLTEFNKYLK